LDWILHTDPTLGLLPSPSTHLHTLLGPFLIFFSPSFSTFWTLSACSALLLALSRLCFALPCLALHHLTSLLPAFPRFFLISHQPLTRVACLSSINTLKLDLDNVVQLDIVTYHLASQWS
jgi:hypothetical protein